jgi:hypothetical protein
MHRSRAGATRQPLRTSTISGLQEIPPVGCSVCILWCSTGLENRYLIRIDGAWTGGGTVAARRLRTVLSGRLLNRLDTSPSHLVGVVVTPCPPVQSWPHDYLMSRIVADQGARVPARTGRVGRRVGHPTSCWVSLVLRGAAQARHPGGRHDHQGAAATPRAGSGAATDRAELDAVPRGVRERGSEGNPNPGPSAKGERRCRALGTAFTAGQPSKGRVSRRARRPHP